MPKARITWADPALPHQIRLRRSTHNKTLVSCNCLMERPVSERTMALITTDTDPWPIYNNPDNHNHRVERFVPITQRTMAQARQKVYEVE